MKKHTLIICAGLLCLAVVCSAASFLSFRLFRVGNPIAAAKGLLTICCTDADYTEIQAYPRVILAKPDSSLDALMETENLYEDNAAQMGALHVYTNGDYSEFIHVSENRFYAKWLWQE